MAQTQQILPLYSRSASAAGSSVDRDKVLKSIIETVIAVVFAVKVDQLQSSSRGRAKIALARQVAMYLAHCAFSLSHSEVGRIYNRDRTTVGHACALVEDRRDDPVFDRTLANIEEIVVRVGRISGVVREGAR